MKKLLICKPYQKNWGMSYNYTMVKLSGYLTGHMYVHSILLEIIRQDIYLTKTEISSNFIYTLSNLSSLFKKFASNINFNQSLIIT